MRRPRLEQVSAESAKLRAHCASKQALIGGLETRRASQIQTQNQNPSDPKRPHGTVSGWQSPPNNVPGRSPPSGRIGALRSLVEKLREGEGPAAGVHGLLADLVLLRRRGDEAAVSAVLGPALGNTVVVRSRADGARFVAEARAAGIPGRVRCDVLDEIKIKGKPSEGGCGGGAAGRRGGGGGGLSLLSECVATSDPRHLPAAEKRLRGW